MRIKQNYPAISQQIHWGPYPMILQVIEGSVLVSINCQRYRLHTGDVACIGSESMYAVERQEGDIDYILFSPAAFGETSALYAIMERHRMPCLCLQDDGKELIANLHNIFANVALQERYMENCAGDLRRTLLAYTDGAYTLVQPESAAHSIKQLTYLRTVLELMNAHLYEQMTLEQLADSVQLSPKYFCRFFQNMTGQKPFAYINHLRVDHACHIFMREKISVKDVAAQLGYKDINYFIKTFKRYCGMTPKKYSSQFYHYADYAVR